jgi:hypothetical protein
MSNFFKKPLKWLKKSNERFSIARQDGVFYDVVVENLRFALFLASIDFILLVLSDVSLSIHIQPILFASRILVRTMWSRYNSFSISKEDVDTGSKTASENHNKTTSDSQTASVGETRQDPLFSPREGLFQKSRSRTLFSNQLNEAPFLGETSYKNSPLEEDLFSAEEKAKYVKTKVKKIYRFGKGGQVEIKQHRTRPRDVV